MKRLSSKTKRIILIVAGTVCLAVFCLSAYKVVDRLVHQNREEKAFEDLVAQLPARPSRPQTPSRPSELEPSGPSEEAPSQTPGVSDDPGVSEDPGSPEDPGAQEAPGGQDPEAGQEPTEDPEPDAAGRYDALYEQNNDLFGWICIEGTDVNFPVMHTPKNPEYYLHRAFDRSYSYSGCPFLEWDCYTDCGNYIVYGHHMTNGTMFATLMKYAKESWWKEHPIIQFDTLTELGNYEVLSAFYTKVYHVGEEGVFKYYAYNELTDEETFNEFVRQAREAALYDTGVEANFGDQLLTLITCNDHTKNGRFVVIARLARDTGADTETENPEDTEAPEDGAAAE